MLRSNAHRNDFQLFFRLTHSSYRKSGILLVLILISAALSCIINYTSDVFCFFPGNPVYVRSGIRFVTPLCLIANQQKAESAVNDFSGA